MSRRLAILGWLLLLLAVADWLALRSGAAPNPPAVLAVLVAAAIAAFAARWLQLLGGVLRGQRCRGTAVAELVLIAGLLTSLLGGTLNWLVSLQGFVILLEGETVELRGGSELQVFEAGPLADLEEMELTLTLDEVELTPTGGGSFYPTSHLTLRRPTGVERVRVDPHDVAAAGALRFFQGAFGFAPRIVILKDDRTIFDRVVPFVTELHEGGGISFQGSFGLEQEELRVEGSVDLASLDEGLRGHATLHAALSREGSGLGRGSLLPGRFARVGEGYDIGFAGLEKWSEVDVSRKNYRSPVVGGAAVALVGLLAWPVAWWRAR